MWSLHRPYCSHSQSEGDDWGVHTPRRPALRAAEGYDGTVHLRRGVGALESVQQRDLGEATPVVRNAAGSYTWEFAGPSTMGFGGFWSSKGGCMETSPSAILLLQ